MNLPTLDQLNIKEKRVLLRLDTDVAIENGEVLDDYRLRTAIPTIKYLIDQGAARIVVLGHRGRPGGKVDKSLKLESVERRLKQLLARVSGVSKDIDLVVLENLRFNPGEEANDLHFARELAKEGDIYVNDAFGVCHREETSTVALPKLFKARSKNSVAAGLHLVEEVRMLSRVLENPKHPVVMVIGGGKLDKVLLIDKLFQHADMVLVGGVLPQKVKTYCRETDGKMCIVAAYITPDGSEITPDSARNFTQVIKEAGTIVWNGPMGDIDSGHWDGTKIIGQAVVKSNAFKVAGGGDTIRALQKMGISDKIDYISTGGGAMLEFLAYGDLPGLKALR